MLPGPRETTTGAGSAAQPAGPQRVLLLAHDMHETGGVQAVTKELVAALDALPYVRPLIAGRTSGGPLLRVVPAALRTPLEKALFSLRVLLIALVRRPTTIVAAHVNLAPLASLAALLSFARVAIWVHGIEVWAPLPPRRRIAVERASAVWCGSRFTLDRLVELGYDPGRLRLLRYCVPRATREAPQVERAAVLEPVVLAVGRLTARNAYKGFDTLVRAWPLVKERAPAARLVVVGDGDDRPRLEGIARDLGVEDSVTFAGRLPDDDLHDLHRTASVFALPGRARFEPRPEGEGFGLVFVEAAWRGVPSVAGAAGGAPEAVADGVSGFVVDPDEGEAVAAAIVKLLADPVAAREMGERASAWVREAFSWDRFVADVDDRLRELQRGRAGAR